MAMSNFRCFKYRQVSKNLIDSLVNSTIYFSSRESLNDPFDSKIDIRQVIESLLKEELPASTREQLVQIAHNETFFQRFDDGYRDFGICSLSTNLSETLMWSHYADQHRGVAVHYDFPIEWLNNPTEIMGVAPVTYDPNTVSDWIRNNAGLFHDGHFQFVTELLKRVLTAKAPAWSYEKEGRIIRQINGPYEIPRELLIGITFGLRTSKEDERLIRSIATTYFSNIQFSRVVRTGSDFGIDIQTA